MTERVPSVTRHSVARRPDTGGASRETHTECTRRGVLRATGGSLGGFGLFGTVGGTTGRRTARYLALCDPFDEPTSRISRTGFSTADELFDGNVQVLTGPPGSRRRLAAISGVVAAFEDERIGANLRGVLPKSGSDATWKSLSASNSLQPTEYQVEADEDDRYVSRQWDKRAIGAFDAHRLATGAGTRIAVIDDGVFAEHPDIQQNFNLEASVRINDGRIFPSRGLNGYGHGTFVAGVAAAGNDGTEGVVGVAPDAELVSVSPTFGGGGPAIDPVGLELFLSDVIRAMEYATRIGADVMNLSLGVLFDFPAAFVRFLRVLTDYLAFNSSPQTVTVIASGNDGIDFSVESGLYDFPGSVPNALTVGSTGPNDRRTSYSTYGAGFVNVGAPGGGYETVVREFCAADGDGDDTGRISSDATGLLLPGATVGDACELPAYPYPRNYIFGPLPPDSVIAQYLTTYPTAGLLSSDRYYAYLAGTSFAAPQVAGVVALVRELAPELPAAAVQRVITATADEVPGESRAGLGAGRVNAERAVSVVSERTGSAATN